MNTYHYKHKNNMMTKAEREFFKTLVDVLFSEYYIFPQVHLSAIVEHKVNGQWLNGAFSHINGKSVDYVICDNFDMRPLLAIEYDDPSHTQPDRIERDIEVERILDEAELPLVRFSYDEDLSKDAITEKLSTVLNFKD